MFYADHYDRTDTTLLKQTDKASRFTQIIAGAQKAPYPPPHADLFQQLRQAILQVFSTKVLCDDLTGGVDE